MTFSMLMPPALYLWQHLFHDLACIAIGVVFEFWGDSMGAQECRNDVKWAFRIEFNKGLQHAQLSLCLQPIARFALYGGCP